MVANTGDGEYRSAAEIQSQEEVQTARDDGVREMLMRRESSIERVPIEGIRVDHRFQRALNLNAVAKIKADYHPKGMGQLLLAGVPPEKEGDPSLACLDGQTRLVAVRDLEQEIAEGKRVIDGFEPVVQAEVFPDLTPEEAALLFRLRNNQRPVPQKDRDRILVTEGDPLMKEVVRQAAEAGYVVFSENPDDITLPFLPESKMVARWGRATEEDNLLTRALTIQARAFEPPEGGLVGSVDPKVLAATGRILLKNPHVDEDELIRVMSSVGLPALRQLGRTRADSEGMRMLGAVRDIIIDRYNKNKKGDERIHK